MDYLGLNIYLNFQLRSMYQYKEINQLKLELEKSLIGHILVHKLITFDL